MGTHPIFESDFDCLTDFQNALAGNWKQTKSEGGMDFLKAIGATAEQMEQAKNTEITVEYKVNGNEVTVSRTYKTAAGAKTITNVSTIGASGEYQFMEHKINCNVTGTDGDLTLKAVSGWATATAKVSG